RTPSPIATRSLRPGSAPGPGATLGWPAFWAPPCISAARCSGASERVDSHPARSAFQACRELARQRILWLNAPPGLQGALGRQRLAERGQGHGVLPRLPREHLARALVPAAPLYVGVVDHAAQ